MQNFIRPHTLGSEMWGEAIRHLKIVDVQPHVLPNFKLTCLRVLYACFSYHFWAYSKNFLVQMYSSSRLLTISTTSLEQSYHPMGMDKSIWLPLIEIFKYMIKFITIFQSWKTKWLIALKLLWMNCLWQYSFKTWCRTMIWQISSISHKGHMWNHKW